MMARMDPADKIYRTKAWREARKIVKARDKGVCQICGKAGADAVDHIVPWRDGGAWYELGNLRLVHGRCNSSRVKRPNRVGTSKRRPSRDW